MSSSYVAPVRSVGRVVVRHDHTRRSCWSAREAANGLLLWVLALFLMMLVIFWSRQKVSKQSGMKVASERVSAGDYDAVAAKRPAS